MEPKTTNETEQPPNLPSTTDKPIKNDISMSENIENNTNISQITTLVETFQSTLSISSTPDKTKNPTNENDSSDDISQEIIPKQSSNVKGIEKNLLLFATNKEKGNNQITNMKNYFNLKKKMMNLQHQNNLAFLPNRLQIQHQKEHSI